MIIVEVVVGSILTIVIMVMLEYCYCKVQMMTTLNRNDAEIAKCLKSLECLHLLACRLLTGTC